MFTENEKIFKVLIAISYILWVVLVPRLPNYYTFTVSTIAYILTLLACLSILDFLCTRPIAQKTLLNRILVLVILILGLASTRTYALNFITCWFHPQLIRFVDNHQFFSTVLFPLNSYSVLGSGILVALCSARLLLIAKPVIYHNSNSNLWFFLVGIGSICICILDSIYSWSTCRNYGHGKNIRLLQIVKTELGLLDDDSESYNKTLDVDIVDTLNRFNVTDWANFNENDTFFNNTNTLTFNVTKSSKTKDGLSNCTFIPVLQLFLSVSIGLEVTRMCLVTRKAVMIQKKKRRIAPTEMKMQGKKETLAQPAKNIAPTKLKRTASLPSITKPSFQDGKRKSSCFELQSIKTVEQIPLKSVNAKEEAETFRTVKKSMHSLCMRSSTIFIVFTIVAEVGISFKTFGDSGSHSGYYSTSNMMNIAAGRLVYYTLAVCMFIFDNDVSRHTLEKF